MAWSFIWSSFIITFVASVLRGRALFIARHTDYIHFVQVTADVAEAIVIRPWASRNEKVCGSMPVAKRAVVDTAIITC
jgi:hypothetical protein